MEECRQFRRVGIPRKIRFEVLKRDSFKCQYCGCSAPDVVLQVDHIDPVANGGSENIVNLITSCQPCNSGKGAILLSDSSSVSKSRRQLEELQQRREQLEMMMEWRNGLREILEDQIDHACNYWQGLCGYGITAAGRQKISNLVKIFSLDEAIISMDDATVYFSIKDDVVALESANIAFDKLPGICRTNRLSKDKPHLKDLYYARGIVRRRVNYFDGQKALQWMECAMTWGVTVEEIGQMVRRVHSWTHFGDEIDRLILSAKEKESQSCRHS